MLAGNSPIMLPDFTALKGRHAAFSFLGLWRRTIYGFVLLRCGTKTGLINSGILGRFP